MRTHEHHLLHVEVAKKQGNTPTVSEDVWVIPAGTKLTVLRFSGGHEYSRSEVRLELCHRVGGQDETIAVGYAGAFQYTIDRGFTGNGSDSIVIRHVNGDAQPLNTASWWEGFTNG